MATKSPFSCFKGGRAATPAAYLSTENWPPFDDSVLQGSVKTRFARLRKAMHLYLADAPMAKVLEIAGVSAGRWQVLYKRCGQVRPDGLIIGWEGLCKGKALAPRVRHAPLVSGAAGMTGGFSMLLRTRPALPKKLMAYLNAQGVRALRPNRVTFRTFHRAFIRFCREEGIGEDEYPLNTRERCRKPLRAWIDAVYMPLYANRFIALESGPDAGGLNAYSEGNGRAEMPHEPYSAWVLDEVAIDVLARHEIPNSQGDWEQLDLARFFQLRIRDRGGANLACRQVYSAQANADDLAVLFWQAVNGPDLVEQTIPGLQAEEGAGYPCQEIPELRFAVPSVIFLDNALAHLAGHVQYIATVLFGARVVMGPPGTPHERAAIESAFATQARRILHQLPGTTGTGPGDPMRQRAAVKVEGRLRAQEVAHLLDVNARNENCLPQAASHNIAPLERLRRQLSAGVLKPRYLPPDKRQPYFFSQAVRVIVKADTKGGIRPYVNYLYVRYSSAELGKAYALEGKPMLLRPDLSNIRTVMLFREDGSLYGPVQALGRWGTFPHDVRLRRLFGKFKRDGQLGDRADDQPLEALFAHLRRKAPRDRRAALQLTYLLTYLSRYQVVVSPALTQQIWELQQLQQAGESMALLPVLDPPAALPAPEDVHIVPQRDTAGRDGHPTRPAPVPAFTRTPQFKPRPSIPR